MPALVVAPWPSVAPFGGHTPHATSMRCSPSTFSATRTHARMPTGTILALRKIRPAPARRRVDSEHRSLGPVSAVHGATLSNTAHMEICQDGAERGARRNAGKEKETAGFLDRLATTWTSYASEPLLQLAEADATLAHGGYSPLNVGFEKEICSSIVSHRLAWLSRTRMKCDEGRSKTPDIRLIALIAVSGPALSESQVAGGPRSEDDAAEYQEERYPRRQRGHQLTDSKAMFASTHSRKGEHGAAAGLCASLRTRHGDILVRFC